MLAVSRSLYELLASPEDEKTRKRRKEPQRRQQRNRDNQRNRNRDGGKSRERNHRRKNSRADKGHKQTSTATPPPSVDCWAEHREAMENGRARKGSGSGRSDAQYVPACKTDGTFEEVQCYKVRTYLTKLTQQCPTIGKPSKFYCSHRGTAGAWTS